MRLHDLQVFSRWYGVISPSPHPRKLRCFENPEAPHTTKRGQRWQCLSASKSAGQPCWLMISWEKTRLQILGMMSSSNIQESRTKPGFLIEWGILDTAHLGVSSSSWGDPLTIAGWFLFGKIPVKLGGFSRGYHDHGNLHCQWGVVWCWMILEVHDLRTPLTEAVRPKPVGLSMCFLMQQLLILASDTIQFRRLLIDGTRTKK